MIHTDILIVGAGPVGLFAVFEAGLLKLRCHLVDALPIPGGQCAELYPKKPIYDIPAFPSVLAGDLIDNLMKQIEPFKPGFTLGERADSIEKTENGFILTTNKGTKISAPVICIAGGLGSFEPRKPQLERLIEFEDKGVNYFVKDPEVFRDKNIVIAGGGDSALDWTINLQPLAKSVALVHRSKLFRGAPDSVEKVMALSEQGKVSLYLDAEVTKLDGGTSLESVEITIKDQPTVTLPTDNFIPLFGLSPKLGPIAEWDLSLEKNFIKVDPITFETSTKGIYAIGDICDYEGKLKLILCGFHEGAMMAHAAYHQMFPEKKLVMKYTTVAGVTGF